MGKEDRLAVQHTPNEADEAHISSGGRDLIPLTEGNLNTLIDHLIKIRDFDKEEGVATSKPVASQREEDKGTSMTRPGDTGSI